MPVPAASSITHQHLLSVIAAEVRDRARIKVVDAGCGGGALVQYLRTALPELLTGCQVEVEGFDVSDFAPHGNTNLKDDTLTVKTGEPWPYPDHSIDVIISNQVLEHVGDHKFFFAQTARCLKRDGVAVHLGPVRECLYDDHVHQPFVHKIKDKTLAKRTIALLRKLGFYSAYYADALPRQPGQEFQEFAADFLAKYCNYIPTRQMVRDARTSGLSVSFDYTPYFYTSKLRALARRPANYFYSKHRLMENASAYLLRYISSITLVLRHS